VQHFANNHAILPSLDAPQDLRFATNITAVCHSMLLDAHAFHISATKPPVASAKLTGQSIQGVRLQVTPDPLHTSQVNTFAQPHSPSLLPVRPAREDSSGATMSMNCYSIDGKPYASFEDYIPCNTSRATGSHTSCCAPGDKCLTNGLCQGQVDSSRKSNLFWRDGCTDPTWKDPACPRVCEGLGCKVSLISLRILELHREVNVMI
jgi:hypothetical protein